MGVIYQIRFEGSTRMYIGSAIDMTRRLYQHRYLLRAGRHHCVGLQRAVAKYGIEHMIHEVLEEGIERQRLFEREQAWIDRFAGNLYNATLSAAGPLGLKKTPEQIERSARFHRGRVRSEATRLLLSVAMKRRYALGTAPDPTPANFTRDVAITKLRSAGMTFDKVGAAFGIGGAAAFHAVKRCRLQLFDYIESLDRPHGGVTAADVHSDWLELLL